MCVRSWHSIPLRRRSFQLVLEGGAEDDVLGVAGNGSLVLSPKEGPFPSTKNIYVKKCTFSNASECLGATKDKLLHF